MRSTGVIVVPIVAGILVGGAACRRRPDDLSTEGNPPSAPVVWRLPADAGLVAEARPQPARVSPPRRPPQKPDAGARPVPRPGPDAAVAAAAPVVTLNPPRANKVQPLGRDPSLQAHGRALFAAIVTNKPERAKGLFFPLAPFLKVKAIRRPDRYWWYLWRAFVKDIYRQHRKRRRWEGTVYQGVELGTRPHWVPPKREFNAIGYYRSFWSKLVYRVRGQRRVLHISTMITWNGRWFITHLLPFRRKKSKK